MILETYHATDLGNGAWIRETIMYEFDTREELDKQLMIYKLGPNLGYRIYDCDMEQFSYPTKDRYIIDQYYDKEAIRATHEQAQQKQTKTNRV